jgi:hypothetical protein
MPTAKTPFTLLVTCDRRLRWTLPHRKWSALLQWTLSADWRAATTVCRTCRRGTTLLPLLRRARWLWRTRTALPTWRPEIARAAAETRARAVVVVERPGLRGGAAAEAATRRRSKSGRRNQSGKRSQSARAGESTLEVALWEAEGAPEEEAAGAPEAEVCSVEVGVPAVGAPEAEDRDRRRRRIRSLCINMTRTTPCRSQ